MKGKELFRLIWLNLTQNKFKTLMTSIGVVVGAATIVMVIAIGRGGQMDVAEQFQNLNAGAIDITYEAANTSKSFDSGTAMPEGIGSQMQNFGNFSGGQTGGPGEMSGTGEMGGTGERPGAADGGSGNAGDAAGDAASGGFDRSQMGGMGGFTMPGSSDMADRMNQEQITLTEDDAEDLAVFVPGLSAVTMTYTTKSTVDGGELDEATSYTIAGVKSNYASLSNLTLAVGSFVEEADEENKSKVCVLGATAATEIFGSAIDAYDSVISIGGQSYVVNGVLNAVGTVSSGISPDEAVFIPYATGVKYITGSNVSPTITVIAEDVSNVETAISQITTVLAESYPNAEFTYTDAGSKMEAASQSNEILTMLLAAMAGIVFLVGGIGIMNVLFVSVKERTNEIGILKAIGCSKKDILLEFLLEAGAISLIGGIVGVGLSFGITPAVEHFGIRVEPTAAAWIIALGFAVLTGTVFGFYPAWKASRLVPVEALTQE